jgi:hypothetical protein
MSRSIVLSALLACTAVSAGAAPIFTDNFTNGSTLFGSSVPGGTPTASFTSYQLASGGRNAAVSSFVNTVSGSALRLTWSGSGSSNLAEGSAIFTTTPVALTAPGDAINVRYTFTNSGNIMSGPMRGANSALGIGLFNSNGSLPLTGTALANNGMSATNGALAAGGVQGWTGYVGTIPINGSSGNVYTRAAQTGTASNNQSLARFGSSANYANPAAATIGSSTVSTVLLTTGTQYTFDYTLTLLASGSIQATQQLFAGVGVGGSLLYAQSGTASGANLVATAFDGFSFGLRSVVTGGSTAAAPLMDMDSITVTATLVPEPTSSVAIVSTLGMAVLMYRRRRARQAE